MTKYPEFLEKVRLVMLTVPSRSSVSDYKRLKKETDEIVGRVNGKFATINWTPIWYFYRSMAFDDLIDLYMTSDIAMITPVRDGMNLVAKEFVATRVKGDGVLILSEMAGASKVLYEAITVNPFDLQEVSFSCICLKLCSEINGPTCVFLSIGSPILSSLNDFFSFDKTMS